MDSKLVTDPGPLRAKPGPDIKIKSGPPAKRQKQWSAKMIINKKDDLREEALSYIEIN